MPHVSTARVACLIALVVAAGSTLQGQLVLNHYTYAPPAARDDGLQVGGVDAAPLDLSRLRQMGEAIAAGRYPDVHGVLIAHRGRLVYEEYFYEYDAQTPHAMRKYILPPLGAPQ